MYPDLEYLENFSSTVVVTHLIFGSVVDVPPNNLPPNCSNLPQMSNFRQRDILHKALLDLSSSKQVQIDITAKAAHPSPVCPKYVTKNELRRLNHPSQD